MQTSFTNVQLADPTIARADAILRRCIHCGLCTATCPTYVLTGDERDSPRGRIYFMKQMFEDREVTASMTYQCPPRSASRDCYSGGAQEQITF